MNVLVVGGAGFIGSHMSLFLRQASCNVVVLDDLSTGCHDAVLGGQLIYGSYGDPLILNRVLNKGIDAVMHFASFSQVEDSVKNPNKYYQNNFINTFHLLDAMKNYGIKHFIFSSTAAVYGEPVYLPIDESHQTAPINAYGQSKLMVEQLLKDYDRAYGIKSVSLRYFNAAGAHPEAILGEMHEPETHLIPLLLQVAAGRRESITLYGDDYETPDGTCIRDYIHVHDLCVAHWLSLQSLLSGGGSKTYNLGTNTGYSVKEVIKAVVRVTGKEIKVNLMPRRIGDPARLVANSNLIRAALSWSPTYSLEDMIAHAWAWEQLKIHS